MNTNIKGLILSICTIFISILSPALTQAANEKNAAINYLPAPGQHVNNKLYNNPNNTLEPSNELVSLGSFGGSIIYKFNPSIKNDPKNPYGIDFIVYGNVFKNSDGSSSPNAYEPGSVMVSKDGITWYELAGSLYFDGNTKHKYSVTYKNPDLSFKKLLNIPFKTNARESGIIPLNSYSQLSMYPNPIIFNKYNLGLAMNKSYNINSVTFEGSLISSNNMPVFGYSDCHASTEKFSPVAVNPYLKEHLINTNGDGMDISWAVDENGIPKELDSVNYVKIYSSLLKSNQEISPEVTFIQVSKPTEKNVGQTDDLESITINGTTIKTTPGVYNYDFDLDGKNSYKASVKHKNRDTNILIGNNYCVSGEETDLILASNSLRVIVQEGKKEPVIYFISFKGKTDTTLNSDIKSIIISPGDIISKQEKSNVFTVRIPSSLAYVTINATPLNEGSKIYVDNKEIYSSNNKSVGYSVPITDLKKKEITLKVLSANGRKTKSYTLKFLKEVEDSNNTFDSVAFSIIGDSRHNEPKFHSTNTKWVDNETFEIPKGSTVKYLLEKALSQKSISFKSINGSYISEINGLGEFDNGPFSGWKYKVNGEFVLYEGYSEYVLKDGDNVEFVFIDDYTL